MSYFDTDRLKQGFFIFLILCLGGLLFWKVSGFFPAFLGALTLYVLMRPAVFYLVYRRRWKKSLTALVLIFISFILLLVPLALIVNMMSGKVTYVVEHSSQIMEGIRGLAEKVRIITRFDLFSDDTIQKLQGAIANFLPRFLGSTFNGLTTLVIMYFVLYFMLTDARRMERTLYEYIPLKEQNVLRLGKEVKDMVFSNAVGIPLLAIVQAVFGMLGYWIFGIADFAFWAVVTGFMSVIPMIGTAAVWIPLSIFLIANGMTWRGIGLAIYGIVVIGNLDNVFRFIWQKKIADVHPLVTAFGVLIGINLFGFIGIVFGPLLISIFMLLLRIYHDEFVVQKSRVVRMEE